ncbi:MAG: class I SAM-dependent methyltransferase [Chitinophagales bacterium]
MLSRLIFRILGPANKRIRSRELFGIGPGYHHARSILQFDDRPNKDEWQKEVYRFAALLMEEKQFESVIDLGCGSGFKLIHELGEYNTTGIELKETFLWLKEKYPDRQWKEFDELHPESLHADLVICVDTIEHVKDPDELLSFIRAIQTHWIILSTPERNRRPGRTDYGPPVNPFHYREWKAVEFKKYIAQWFHIEDQRTFNDRSFTQVLICKK